MTMSVPFWNCTLGELPNSKNMLMSVISRLGACGGREKREGKMEREGDGGKNG